VIETKIRVFQRYPSIPAGRLATSAFTVQTNGQPLESSQRELEKTPKTGAMLSLGRVQGESPMKLSTRNGVGRSFWLFAFMAFNCHPALAASANIVAFGASDTLGTGKAGTGVSQAEAFPAQIQNLLLAKGIDAHVSNAGVPGDTTGGMLSRIHSAVPDGTQIVLLEVPTGNDRKFNISAAESDRNVAQIKADLGARHIKVIYIGPTNNGAMPPEELNGDHPNKAWHTALALKLLPRVLAAIRH
jgi:acyl-CoA thioesterase-1